MKVTKGYRDGWHGKCGFCGSVANGIVCPKCGLWSNVEYDVDAIPIAAKWTATVKRDDAGDLFVVIPQPVFEAMGWKIGDDIVWTVNEDGSATVSKP